MSEQSKIGDLISEREKTHGDYLLNAETSQCLKQVLRNAPNWNRLSFMQRESLELICTKLGRMMAGDPAFAEHWEDIEGYARLVSMRLK